MEYIAGDLAQMARTLLHDAHVAAMYEIGEIAEYAAEQVIALPGDPTDTFQYLLAGEVVIFDQQTGERTTQFSLGPNQSWAKSHS